MDYLPFILTIVLPLTITTLYFLKIFRPNLNKSKKTRAPEPPGSRPIIGHLHLLNTPTPVARVLGNIADKYGPIFSLRFGSHQALVVSNREVIKECFTTNDRVFATRPNMAVGKYMCYDNAAFAISPYGPYWRDIRKMVTLELLTVHRLHQLSPVRASEADYLIKELYSKSLQHPNKAVTVSSFIESFSFNLPLRMLVGKRFALGGGVDREEDKFRNAITKALFYAGAFVLSDSIPWLEWFDIGGHVKGMKENFKELDKVFEEWLQERLKKRKENGYVDGDQSDLLDVMLSTIQENEMVSGFDRNTVIKSTILILMMTGSESTAEVIVWALSSLINNPHVLKTAQDEIEATIGHDRWVEESDLSKLNYLHAIVKETLRLYPPGPVSGPREAIQDCYVGDYFVPKGTRLIVNLWKLMRDPNCWDKPEEFRPERFLDEHTDLNFKGQCFDFIPFSSGRRMCPAMVLGSQVVHYMLAHMIQAFNMSTPNGEPVDMDEGVGISLPKLKPLEVILTPRLPRELYA